MKESTGDLWDAKPEFIRCITTNGIVKKDGCAVMGKGVALQAARRFPKLLRLLGKYLKEFRNSVHSFGSEYRIISFPTKDDWREDSSLEIIEESCQRLRDAFEYTELGYFVKKIYMPRPGCGCGNLNWKDVKPILEKYLDDRFIVVDRSR